MREHFTTVRAQSVSNKITVWGGASEKSHLESPRRGTAVVSRAVLEIFPADSQIGM